MAWQKRSRPMQEPVAPRLSLVDLQGREDRQFAAGSFNAGRYAFNWDGHSSGRTEAAGLYFLRFETPSRACVQRLVITR